MMQSRIPVLAVEGCRAPLVPVKYYGINVAESERKDFSCLNYVVQSIASVKAFSRKVGVAEMRFKVFSSLEEACQFVSLPFHVACGQTLDAVDEVTQTGPFSVCATAVEPKSNFPSLTPQMFVKLRLDIEYGRVIAFLEKVWSNPRYLIGNSDGPTILQEGTRYNALHVAAKAGQEQLVFIIINTLKDYNFISLLYPEKDVAMVTAMSRHILDLYLNMPCKALHETPLHIASKFGRDVIVRKLMGCHMCEKRHNKYMKMPEDMISERRKDASDAVKERIRLSLDGVKFVAILRHVDSGLPNVNYLCSEEFTGESLAGRVTGPGFFLSRDTNLACVAFAGPFPESFAKKFLDMFRSKQFHGFFAEAMDEATAGAKADALKNMCLSDSMKGVERVGRIITQDINGGWIEFFSMFDGYLSASSGVVVLESHFKSLRYLNQFRLSTSSLSLAEHCEKFVAFVDTFLIDTICQKLLLINSTLPYFGYCYLNLELYFMDSFQDILSHILCLTSTSFKSDICDKSDIHLSLGLCLYMKFSRLIDEKNLHDLVMILTSLLSATRLTAINYKQIICILLFFCHFHFVTAMLQATSKNIDQERPALKHFSSLQPVCHCTWVHHPAKYPTSTFPVYPVSLFCHLLFKRFHPFFKMGDKGPFTLRTIYAKYLKIPVEKESDISSPAVPCSSSHLARESISSPSLSSKGKDDDVETSSILYKTYSEFPVAHESISSSSVSDGESGWETLSTDTYRTESDVCVSQRSSHTNMSDILSAGDKSDCETLSTKTCNTPSEASMTPQSTYHLARESVSEREAKEDKEKSGVDTCTQSAFAPEVPSTQSSTHHLVRENMSDVSLFSSLSSDEEKDIEVSSTLSYKTTLEEFVPISKSSSPFHLAAENVSDLVGASLASAPETFECYIDGSYEISSHDIDAYRWLENVNIDEREFPNLFRWKNLVEMKIEESFVPKNTQLYCPRTPAYSSTRLQKRIADRGCTKPKKLFD